MAIRQPILWIAILAGAPAAFAQTAPAYASSYSIATPKPISPAEGTTTPSAQAAQRQNPYLGSVPAKSTGTTISLTLQDAIARGLRYNLGLVESEHASADVHADRLRALSSLLPQISATARQGFENISYREIGLKLPPIPGLPPLPATSGGFGYQDGAPRSGDSQADRDDSHDSSRVIVFGDLPRCISINANSTSRMVCHAPTKALHLESSPGFEGGRHCTERDVKGVSAR